MTELQKLEQQVAELQATIERMKEPEFTYPMWFKNNNNRDTFKFTSLCYGESITQKVGVHRITRTSHTDTDIWTQVPEPIKQWEPQGGMYWIGVSNDIRCNNSSNGTRLNGTEYKTKEQAEWASKQMRKFNRLLAYVAEHDVDENGKQLALCGNRYYVVFDGEKWIHDWHHSRVISSIVYMSKQCAKDLADKLNSGEVVL